MYYKGYCMKKLLISPIIGILVTAYFMAIMGWKFQNSILYGIVAFLVTFIVILICTKPKLTLNPKNDVGKNEIKKKGVQKAFASLGDMSRKHRDEIINVCGNPRKIVETASGTKEQWWDFFYFIEISFDEKGNFQGKEREELGNSPTFRKTALSLIGCCIIVICIFLIPAFSSSSNTSRGLGDSYGHDKFDAHVIAEKVVSEQLKSPSTAKFSKTSECTISVDGNTWTVSGWVDAQNSFGATLRNNYTVKITFSSKEKYTVDKCNIN